MDEKVLNSSMNFTSTRMINKSQRQEKAKVNFNFPKSSKSKIKKKIALFDLDETLVHCTGDLSSKKRNRKR